MEDTSPFLRVASVYADDRFWPTTAMGDAEINLWRITATV